MKLVLALVLGIFLQGGFGFIDSAFAVDAVLTWQDNSGNDPLVNDQETGFRIERKLNAGNYVVLTTVGTNIITVTDTTLVQAIGTSNVYCYRLLAFNIVGDSAYSNEACKTLAPLPLSTPKPATNLIIK